MTLIFLFGYGPKICNILSENCSILSVSKLQEFDCISTHFLWGLFMLSSFSSCSCWNSVAIWMKAWENAVLTFRQCLIHYDSYRFNTVSFSNLGCNLVAVDLNCMWTLLNSGTSSVLRTSAPSSQGSTLINIHSFVVRIWCSAFLKWTLLRRIDLGPLLSFRIASWRWTIVPESICS